MAIKKSELYSSLWASCDELRGGMDASQYKDYVLVMLFIKYVSDKFADIPYASIIIPKGSSFKDMVALKGTSDIGDQINKKIIDPLAKANRLRIKADFNETALLGTGKEMVDRLTNLIAIFEKPELDFSKNRADGDDILGDAYEYLMRHFASESGKSKGQFYTPAEVSRIMAKIIGIGGARTTSETTVYDPTCGSGSLLLKVGDEAATPVTLYGQEKDEATSGLAHMNMILHNNPTALIAQGNTLADPKFKEGESLKTFDYVVANPPFSDKRWSTGLSPLNDPFDRFDTFGVPPAKQGDFAYLLHIIRSLKNTGKGACILPHGILFRGNAEANIRRNLIRRGYIKGVIGLPANLFFGTGIPACIIVIDKEDAQSRKGIFMVDASRGFMKDGPKNRLREQDVHKIVDVFMRQDSRDPKFGRMVSYEEIEKNEFNLHLPRYVDSSMAEDLQDIDGHLNGGIPVADIDALQNYWAVCPELKDALFKSNRPGYFDLAIAKPDIKTSIYAHPQFSTFIVDMNTYFDQWRKPVITTLKALQVGFHPKELIAEVAEGLLTHYQGRALIDAYDVYQHLMNYWEATMQDDCYLIAADGWKAETYRVIEIKKGKDGKPDKQLDKGWTCDLVPKQLIVARYFSKEQDCINQLVADLENANTLLTELQEENSGEEGILGQVENRNDALDALREAILLVWQLASPTSHAKYSAAVKKRKAAWQRVSDMIDDTRMHNIANAKGKVTVAVINARLKTNIADEERVFLELYKTAVATVKSFDEIVSNLFDEAEKDALARLPLEPENDDLNELRVLSRYLDLVDEVSTLKSAVRVAEDALDILAFEKYPELTVDDIKTLTVEDKWIAVLDAAIHGEMNSISHALTHRVKELVERYETTQSTITKNVISSEFKVAIHLRKMGFVL
ncbi:type I restriction-modification system subunit M [Undibacterium parvum]|uniref:site-specific DNA-methyltransferase (adenine-specific) n=2 Tax=Undibacterium TaxID=401469 RepID=A0A6M4A398_9BURK|nr:type I restriction-modification system subunit M [Undibacterium parvum]AZP11217.1 type I restriction-modification system subunit M [Undibacterium parvum]QJQ05741.1 type I restriction-modification system subunit M [Undibacterium piscinae]